MHGPKQSSAQKKKSLKWSSETVIEIFKIYIFHNFPIITNKDLTKRKRKKQENTIGNTEIKPAVNMLRMKKEKKKKQLVLKEK